ncbi:MAG: LysM peptidoglycan-binding domain-containing protein [Clostridium sp.]|uniref:LysM peptidoglycan-binding domain-containing protein n=1 Tax=Clostridium sp. TaxID=1506 RepID=UPI0030721030
MKFKKQIIIIISCAIVLGGIFFAVSYIGDKEQVKKDSEDGIVNNSEVKTGNEAKNPLTEDKVNDNAKTDDSNKVETSKAEVKEGYYIVKANDTLYSIAKKYMPKSETSKIVEAILKRNNMTKDDVIKEGQKIVISYETALVSGEKAESDTATDKVNSSEHTKHIQYTVKSGDTLYSISNQYLPNMDTNKGVEVIKAHNKIENENTIKESETICIPKE